MVFSGLKQPIVSVIFAVFLLSNGAWGQLDRSRYIALDEVRTDMPAYTLTVLYGTEIEKFPLKVLSVVRNRAPGSDMILVVGTDERFKDTGAIHGCSGSPVFIDGRLAGALAAGWDGALEPLYLVRPIEDMLSVGTASGSAASTAGAGRVHLDFSRPLDLEAVAEQATAAMGSKPAAEGLPLMLATSLPAQVCRAMGDSLSFPGMTLTPGAMTAPAQAEAIDVPIERGSTLAAVLCSGDINMAAVGTTTEVVGDTVYGFGHSFTGIGAVEFPMAAGKVHTVVAGRDYSFKFASSGPILGTIQFDQNAAIRGKIGTMPAMVPMRMTIHHFNDPQVRTYACSLALDRDYTPMIARSVAQAAALMQGSLPPEHSVRYTGRIAVAGGREIAFGNVSSGRGVSDIGMELLSSLTMMLNNPFEMVKPETIDVEIWIEPQDTTAGIWSARLSRTTVKPGRTVTADVMLQTFRSTRRVVSVELTVPETLPPGTYPLQLMGASAYNAFLNQNAPQRFRVLDTASLLTGLDRVLNMPRNRLYAVLSVPATGLTLRRYELPDLPPSRMLLIQDSKRVEPIEPFKNWVEQYTELDTIVSGAVQLELTVEQP